MAPESRSHRKTTKEDFLTCSVKGVCSVLGMSVRCCLRGASDACSAPGAPAALGGLVGSCSTQNGLALLLSLRCGPLQMRVQHILQHYAPETGNRACMIGSRYSC